MDSAVDHRRTSALRDPALHAPAAEPNAAHYMLKNVLHILAPIQPGIQALDSFEPASYHT